MIRAAALHEWATSQNAFDALADKAPAVFADRQVGTAARDLAVGLEKEGAGEKVFDRLARGLGTAGLDILYTIVESRGGSKPRQRAAVDLLRETEVSKRATPALRIAFELREAPCDKKGDLLEQRRQGGRRPGTLVVLKTMTSSRFKRSKPLALAIYEVTRARQEDHRSRRRAARAASRSRRRRSRRSRSARRRSSSSPEVRFASRRRVPG